MSTNTPPVELVLSRLFARYLGAGGPKYDIYGNEIPLTPLDPGKEPLEMIAMQLMELNNTMDRIASALQTIADKE